MTENKLYINQGKYNTSIIIRDVLYEIEKRYKVTTWTIYKMTQDPKIRRTDTTRLKNKIRILTVI